MNIKQEQQVSGFKSGLVAIVGRPNVGKSTLVNLLVRFKLAGISPKPQTTRHKILGVLTGEGYQVAFLDTPGMPYRTAHELDRLLVMRVMEAIEEADLVVLVVEPKPPADIERRLIEALRDKGKPAILTINKVDTVKKPLILPVMDEYQRLYLFLGIVPISALKQDGVDRLLDLMVCHLPAGEPVFSLDEVTDRPERFLVGEIVREKVFNIYALEVPYAVAVEVEVFQETSEEYGGKDYIKVILYVEKESQKAILIGRGGEMLKEVGTQARQEIEEVLGRSVHLELWVKVYPKWRKDKAFLQRIGY